MNSAVHHDDIEQQPPTLRELLKTTETERDALLQRLDEEYAQHARTFTLLHEDIQKWEIVKRIKWDAHQGPAVESITVTASCDLLGAYSIVTVIIRTDRPDEEVAADLIESVKSMRQGLVDDQIKIHQVTAGGSNAER